jgi:hypothetical protein
MSAMTRRRVLRRLAIAAAVLLPPCFFACNSRPLAMQALHYSNFWIGRMNPWYQGFVGRHPYVLRWQCHVQGKLHEHGTGGRGAPLLWPSWLCDPRRA